jgi:phage tail sheath gpL-like
MTIPIAVSPGTLTPGLYLIVNLIAGAASPSVGTLRALMIAPVASDGDLTPDTEFRAGGGADSAQVAYGVGAPGHLMAKQLYAEHPTAVVDFAGAPAATGTATGDLTFTGAPTSNTAVRIDVMGREFDVGWLVGDDIDLDFRARVIDAINQRSADLSVVASAGASGIVTCTFKVNGNIGNDCKISAKLLNPQSGTETASPNTLTALTGGSTDADLTTVLANASGEEYHFIVPALSNADAVATGASNNPARVISHIEGLNTGLNAMLQQLITASTTTLALATAAAEDRNVGFAQHDLTINGRSLPCEFAGAEAGSRLQWISVDPAANRIGVQKGTSGALLYGSADTIADKPTFAESETAIGAGVSINSYDAAGNIIAVRPVTTVSQDAQGAPERRLLDTQNVDAVYIVARDLRSSLPAEFPNAKISRDTLPGEDPPPVGVIEERDVKGFTISRLRFWEKQGVVLKSALDTVIANGELIVQVNASDPSQVDILVPITIVPPLAKFGVVVNRNPAT